MFPDLVLDLVYYYLHRSRYMIVCNELRQRWLTFRYKSMKTRIQDDICENYYRRYFDISLAKHKLVLVYTRFSGIYEYFDEWWDYGTNDYVSSCPPMVYWDNMIKIDRDEFVSYIEEIFDFVFQQNCWQKVGGLSGLRLE